MSKHIASNMLCTKILRHYETGDKYSWIILQCFCVWYVGLYLFPSGIWQIAYPYASIGKSESTDNCMWFFIQFVIIRLSQQLLCIRKTIVGEKVVKVFISTSEALNILRSIQPVQGACSVKKTHLNYKCDLANILRTSSIPRLYLSFTAFSSSGVRWSIF